MPRMKNRLAEIRKQLGISQAQLAQELSTTQGNVSHIETGRQILTLENAAALIGVCRERGMDIGLDDIFIFQASQEKSHEAQPEKD